MRVGLFGGSFNPPHLGHLALAETVRDVFGFDRVLWIPARQPPHKPVGALVEARHRLQMTRLAVDDNPGFAVSEIELERNGPSYTVDTLALLQQRRPAWTLHLIIGADSLAGLHTWRRPREILERAHLVVYPRADADLSAVDPAVLERVRFVEAPLLTLSSTDVRARCRDGRSIRYLVPEAVRTYIAEQGLYGAMEDGE